MQVDKRRAIAAPYAWKGADLQPNVTRFRTQRTGVHARRRESIA
ncbi:MAG TPA: hypothetical protein VD867_01710 [Burkholderiales bacterium]|nr:hypothetical protein [Burkholderiales bacterium]